MTVVLGENNVGKTALFDALDIALSGRGAATTDLRVRPNGSVSPELVVDLELGPWSGVKISDDVLDVFGAQVNAEPGTGRQRYFLRVIGTTDASKRAIKLRRGLVSDWDAATTADLAELDAVQRQSLWFSVLDARRDLVDDLRHRSSPWGKLLRRLQLDDVKRQQFEQQLSALSAQVMTALPDAAGLAVSLSRLSSVLSGQVTAARLSLLPKSIDELWRTTDLLVQAGAQAELPIGQQGMGARSLSSLLAFRAWLVAELAVVTAESGPPFLVLSAFEEPEAHLHPQAQRAVFHEIKAVHGQRLISTHSPYVASVAMMADYRVVRRSPGVSIRSASGLAADPSVEAKQLENIRRFCVERNADMVFARLVVLCEGETDAAVLRALAGVHFGMEPEHRGVTVVDMAGAGNTRTFVRYLDALGVPWVLLTDGDSAGRGEIAKLEADPLQAAHVPIDVFLCDVPDEPSDIERVIARFAPTAALRALGPAPGGAATPPGAPTEAELVRRLRDVKGAKSRRLAAELATEWTTLAAMPPVFRALFARADALL